MATAAVDEPQASTAIPQDAPQAAQSQPLPPPLPLPQAQRSNKSWRKKYYKMRHEFQKLMARNNHQFEEEQKALRMARRLQEQNDQLLDTLYDMNRAPRLSTQLRYDIRSPVPTSAQPVLSLDDDELELEDSLSYNPMRVLSRLESIPHSSISDLPNDPLIRKNLEDFFVEDEPIGYLSPAHEEEYLAAIDAHVPNALNENTNQIHVPLGPWSARDPSAAAAANPVSVLNWLKSHTDIMEENAREGRKEAAGTTKEEKAAAKAAPTKVMPKRASVGAKHEYEEVLDEDGQVISIIKPETASAIGTGRGRKRALVDDDGAYRPKGGSGRKKKKMSVGEKTGAASALSAAFDPPEPAAD